MRAFQRFFEDEYRKAARTTIGASALPAGRDYYADMVRYFTTLADATPECIHATGVAEVARIRAEMETILRDIDHRGDFADFLAFLRTDPQFRAKSATELLREAAWIAKEIDGMLPDYFGRLPRMPYGVKPVPDALAPNYTAGRYNPGPLGAAGEYWVNTYAPDTRLLYVLPALTLHEAVPGHHLQGALARELSDLPAFRLNFYPHAFGEGWALYCEKLGEEMGVYHTPYQRFGRLTYEMWRACRLVVDTGMHAMGWTREQAQGLPRVEHRIVAARDPHRSRSLYRVAGTGARLQGRRVEDRRAPEARGSGAGRRFRRARVPRRGARERRGDARGAGTADRRVHRAGRRKRVSARPPHEVGHARRLAPRLPEEPHRCEPFGARCAIMVAPFLRRRRP